MAEQLAAMQAQIQALLALLDPTHVQAAADQAAAEHAATGRGGAEVPPQDPHSLEPEHDQQDGVPAHGTVAAIAKSAKHKKYWRESFDSMVSVFHERPPDLALDASDFFSLKQQQLSDDLTSATSTMNIVIDSGIKFLATKLVVLDMLLQPVGFSQPFFPDRPATQRYVHAVAAIRDACAPQVCKRCLN